MLFTLFLLLVIFQLKHFLADFPLQNTYMLGKMQRTNWSKPLLAHVSVHSLFTFVITLVFTRDYELALTLATTDLIIHFIVDRIKASPSIGGRFTPNQPYFWWALGADQMAHHLTHYVCIYLIITSLY